MCGIFCALSRTHHVLPNEDIQQRLQARGPDSVRTIQIPYNQTSSQDAYITLCSTVLSLRGANTVTQPFQDQNAKYTLCWNGEAWSIDYRPAVGNDTAAIHELLVNAVEACSEDACFKGTTESADRIAKALSRVAGPYAFVFFDQPRGRLFFGRDFLGRRSLLTRITSSGDLLISSVSDGNAPDGWAEIDADGVYCVDLHAHKEPDPSSGSQLCKWGKFFAASVPSILPKGVLSIKTESSTRVVQRLSLNKDIPSAIEPLKELSPAVEALERLLRESLSLRILNIPEPPAVYNATTSHSRAKLAILFSGGLDCTVLARLSHELLPQDEPIDLLNVAFENPRVHKSAKDDSNGTSSISELCPDRITGRASFAELSNICPGRIWRFVAINVPYTETLQHRSDVVSLMHPHNTEMDLSISYALNFAARGRGEICEALGNVSAPYTTSARVLLSGLGADELFGGYSRHTTAFNRKGFPGLLDELELDVSRLGQRNLGRDDRVMSHWSKEVRFPYLDEKVLSWALNAPVTEKCGFGEPDAVLDGDVEALEPEKKVLRCLASKLGMKNVAREKKRAIQFGARTAKMETGKTKGTQLLS